MASVAEGGGTKREMMEGRRWRTAWGVSGDARWMGLEVGHERAESFGSSRKPEVRGAVSEAVHQIEGGAGVADEDTCLQAGDLSKTHLVHCPKDRLAQKLAPAFIGRDRPDNVRPVVQGHLVVELRLPGVRCGAQGATERLIGRGGRGRRGRVLTALPVPRTSTRGFSAGIRWDRVDSYCPLVGANRARAGVGQPVEGACADFAATHHLVVLQ